MFLKYSSIHIQDPIQYCYQNERSSRSDVFCKKDVLKNFAKFTGKYLCQTLFFNKVAGGACNFIKKEALAQMFSYEFCEISKNTFFYRTRLVVAYGMIQSNVDALALKVYHQLISRHLFQIHSFTEKNLNGKLHFLCNVDETVYHYED